MAIILRYVYVYSLLRIKQFLLIFGCDYVYHTLHLPSSIMNIELAEEHPSGFNLLAFLVGFFMKTKLQPQTKGRFLYTKSNLSPSSSIHLSFCFYFSPLSSLISILMEI